MDKLNARLDGELREQNYKVDASAKFDLTKFFEHLNREVTSYFTHVNWKTDYIPDDNHNKGVSGGLPNSKQLLLTNDKTDGKKGGNKSNPDEKSNSKNNSKNNSNSDATKKNKDRAKSAKESAPTKPVYRIRKQDYNGLSDAEKEMFNTFRTNVMEQRKLEIDAITDGKKIPAAPANTSWDTFEDSLKIKLQKMVKDASDEFKAENVAKAADDSISDKTSTKKPDTKKKKITATINYVLDSTSKSALTVSDEFIQPDIANDEEEYEVQVENEIIPAKFDTGCKPYDIVTSACIQKYFSHIKQTPLQESVDLLQVSGVLCHSYSFITLNVTVYSQTGHSITFKMTPLVITSDHEILLIGYCTLKIHGLINFSKNIKHLSSQFNSNTVFAVIEEDKNEKTVEAGIAEIKRKIISAYENDLKKEWKNGEVSLLLNLIDKYSHCFRVNLNKSPLAKFPPLKLELIDPKQKPFISKVRKMNADKATYLDYQTNLLVQNNLAYIDTQATWISSAFAVPKGSKLRMVLDYVKVNDCLKLYSWPMPTIDNIGEDVAGSNIFGTMDLDNCYYQFPLHPDSQKFLSYQTTTQVLTPRVVPMGIHNAVAYVQSCINIMLQGIKKNTKSWVDDILAHAKDFISYVNIVEKLFICLTERSLFLNPWKCDFLKSEVIWLGRTISAEGMSYPEKDLEPFKNMHEPTNAAELQAFICGLNWFRNSIANYSTLIKDLQDLLLLCTRKANTAKKSQLKKIDLTSMWKEKHSKCFENIKQALMHLLTISFLLPGGKLNVFTDASDVGWGVMLTQVMFWDKNKELDQQDHRIIGVASGIYSEKEAIAPINEKEASAINEAIERFTHFLQRPEGFTLFTDHFNLEQMLDISNDKCAIHKNTRLKLARIAGNICRFIFEHVKIYGDKNYWGDRFSRPKEELVKMFRAFMNCPIQKNSELQNTAFSLTIPEITNPIIANIFSVSNYVVEKTPKYREFHKLDTFEPLQTVTWPRLDYILIRQKLSLSTISITKNSKITFNAQRKIYEINSIIWIPDEDIFLQQLLCFIAHNFGAAHLRLELAQQNLKKHVYWTNMNADIKKFCADCLQCQLFNNGKMIKREYGQQLIATFDKRILQFDYLYIRPGEYILVLLDKLTSFSWLFYTTDADADTVIQAFREYDKIIGLPKTWISDQGTHFKNTLVENMAKILQISHHFTTAYCPWSNGSVERLNKSILNLLRKLLSSNQLNWLQWNTLLPTINKLLNERPLSRSPYVSPHELMFGKEPLSNLDILYANETLTTPIYPTDLNEMLQDLREKLKELHELLEIPNAKNKQASGVKYNFNIGDFVLVATHIEHLPSKLKARWNGPFKISKSINSHVFNVTDLLPPYSEITAHVTRMKKFNGTVLPTDESFIKQSTYDRDSYQYESFKDLISEGNQLKFLVKWLGYSESENTYETIQSCYDFHPSMVKDFLFNLSPQHTWKGKALKTLGL
jgi:hypothetical protein